MGLWGGIKSFFGGKTTTTTQALDPATQAYVNAQRAQAQGAGNVALNGPAGGGTWALGPETMSIGDQAAAFFNPYQQNVVNAVGNQYDRLRADALNQSKMGGAGTFGGSRNAVMAGARLGELDAGQGQTIAGLLNSGYNNALNQGVQYQQYQHGLAQDARMDPLFRNQTAQGFFNNGLGPYGMSTTQSSSGGQFGDILKFGAGVGSLAVGAGWNPFGGGNKAGGLSGYQMPGNANVPGAQPNMGYPGVQMPTLFRPY